MSTPKQYGLVRNVNVKKKKKKKKSKPKRGALSGSVFGALDDQVASAEQAANSFGVRV
jgi:hypothetical protein